MGFGEIPVRLLGRAANRLGFGNIFVSVARVPRQARLGLRPVPGVVPASASATVAPNYAFKPNPLRYAAQAASKACHLVHSTARVGLT